MSQRDSPESPFFRLPPELRNKIYNTILGGRTIHINTTLGRGRRIHIYFNRCGKGNSLKSLSHLIGAAHSQGSVLSTESTNWEPCAGADHVRDICQRSFSLDVQLLRVCRQIHDETALILYAENSFILGTGMAQKFRKAFCKLFSSDQRGAIQTVAVLFIARRDIEVLPIVLPGLKRLWMRSCFWPSDLRRFETKQFSTFIESLERAGRPRLVGAGFKYDWEEDVDQDLLEKLEMGLLRRSQSK